MALIDTLEDPDRSVRAGAAQALGNIGRYAYPAIPALIRVLKDNDSTVRFHAIEALGKIGPASHPAVPALTAILKEKVSNERLNERSAAAVALNQITVSSLVHQSHVRCHSPDTCLSVHAPLKCSPIAEQSRYSRSLN